MFNYLISGVAGGDAQALDTFKGHLDKLVSQSFKYLIGIGISLVVLWAVYIGVKVLSAKKAEQRVEAKTMLKQFILGVVLIFVLAVGAPLLIQALIAWAQESGLTQGVVGIMNI